MNDALQAAHQQLKTDRTIDVELGSLDQLLDGDGRERSRTKPGSRR